MQKILGVCLVTLLATPLSGEVFAQEGEETFSLESSSSTATTSDVVLVTENEAEPWYRTERIFGNIDIGDFVVGPGRSEIEVSPGETVIQEIAVTNRISDGRSFKLEIEDVVGSADGSSAVSLTGSKRGPYSVRDYLSFPEDTFTIDLGERALIPVKITIPPNTEPGGYYGSVLVSTVRVNEGGAELAPRQPIIARVGSLIFIRVRGDAVTEGQTKEVSIIGDKWWFESGPIELGVLYENSGSVHVNPYGEISVKNLFGEEVGFVELEPWFVLPKSLRVREVSWDREFLLGRYTVTARINRGYEDVVDEVTTTFWVLPWKIVGGMFLVLFIIFFGIRAFFRTFEFKRKGD
ncbi:MAG: hypothetical protein KC877_00305 [Candidatus Kaiserbacteria bacterium]|nr:hypothetical protein [Candidatus Kaiserbacteria bacterium]MCB9816268.1 hypothetical protein [Candidatus Nomurabacteria bacterium]